MSITKNIIPRAIAKYNNHAGWTAPSEQSSSTPENMSYIKDHSLFVNLLVFINFLYLLGSSPGSKTNTLADAETVPSSPGIGPILSDEQSTVTQPPMTKINHFYVSNK